MIATALAGRPSLLIADEPTSALDVTTQATVIDLLRGLGESGEMSTILITHDLAMVASFAQAVIVMYAGNIVEIGAVDDIYKHAGHPYTQALLAAIPNIWEDRRRQLDSIIGAMPDLTQQSRGCSFEPRCPFGKGRDICKNQIPELVRLRLGNQVACHFAAEVQSGVASKSPDWERVSAGESSSIETPVELNKYSGTDTNPILSVTDLVKTFRGKARTLSSRTHVVALGGVDLILREGESVGIVGESGSGKTTLGRVIVGLETKDSGIVRFRRDSGELLDGLAAFRQFDNEWCAPDQVTPLRLGIPWQFFDHAPPALIFRPRYLCQCCRERTGQRMKPNCRAIDREGLIRVLSFQNQIRQLMPYDGRPVN